MDIDIIELFKHSKITKSYTPGDVIFEQGSSGETMYIVLEGVVQVTVNGKEVAELKAGHILGEMSIVEKRPRSASAISKTDSKLVPIDKESFLYIVKENPQFALFIMKDLSHKIRELNQLLTA